MNFALIVRQCPSPPPPVTSYCSLGILAYAMYIHHDACYRYVEKDGILHSEMPLKARQTRKHLLEEPRTSSSHNSIDPFGFTA